MKKLDLVIESKLWSNLIKKLDKNVGRNLCNLDVANNPTKVLWRELRVGTEVNQGAFFDLQLYVKSDVMDVD